MKRILIIRRAHDYHACIEGHSEIWECGRTDVEAVGWLVLRRAKDLGTEVAFEPPVNQPVSDGRNLDTGEGYIT